MSASGAHAALPKSTRRPRRPSRFPSGPQTHAPPFARRVALPAPRTVSARPLRSPHACAAPRALGSPVARARPFPPRGLYSGFPRPPRARARLETPPSRPEGRGPSAAPFVPARRPGVAPRAPWGRGGSGPEPAPRVRRCRRRQCSGLAPPWEASRTRRSCALVWAPREASGSSCGCLVMGSFEPALLPLSARPGGAGGYQCPEGHVPSVPRV